MFDLSIHLSKYNVSYVGMCKVKFLERLNMNRSLICNKRTKQYNAWFKASTGKETRSALFWVITQRTIFFWCCGLTRAMATSFLGFWITHTNAPHSLGLLRTSNHLFAETSTWQQHSQLKNIHYPPEFKPTISADERPQTNALDRPTTGTGVKLSNIPEERRSYQNSKLLYSGVWCRVGWYTRTDVQKELAASNIGVHL
jgi:hypothetical protein